MKVLIIGSKLFSLQRHCYCIGFGSIFLQSYRVKWFLNKDEMGIFFYNEMFFTVIINFVIVLKFYEVFKNF